MDYRQLAKEVQLVGIMNSTNSSVQHVAWNTQKDFVVQDNLYRGAISFETKPHRKQHRETSKNSKDCVKIATH